MMSLQKGEVNLTQLNAALFDLDGTIIDSEPGITATFDYTLSQFGISYPREQMRAFLGPPLSESFARLVRPEEVDRCVEIYRRRYAEDGIYRCAVYPGIPDVFRQLKEQGWTVCLATSKLREAAVTILDRFELTPFFDLIGGSSADGSIETKEEVLRSILPALEAQGRHGVMIGDRFHDMEGAARCGLPAVGVLYGYGDEAELSAYQPLALCKSPKELGDFLSLHFNQ